MFREVIVAFQQFITIYVNEYRCIDDHVASATKVLGILWSANQSGGLLSYKVPDPNRGFINPGVWGKEP